MKTIFIIKFCVAVLLTIIPDDIRTESIIKVLEKMAKSGEKIHGIFIPALNGSLGESYHGTLYRGQFLPLGDTEVAMKFTPIRDIESSKNEYRMYTHLDAIDKSSVEAYGIPTIYYYGTWNNYTVLAMTLLKTTSRQIFGMTEEDVLVACREFVRTIKYVHSKGITHGAMTIENMIIRNDRGFIHNFDLSKDMANRTRKANIADAKYDFRFFLYSLLKLKSVWQWFGFNNRAVQRMDYLTFLDKSAEAANWNEENIFTGLKRIYVEFSKHAVDNLKTRVKDANGTWIPFYDYLYQVIDEEIKICGEEDSSSNLSITDIPDPFGTYEWFRSPVNYEYFENEYSGARNKAHEKASKSTGCFLTKLCGK